MKRLLLFMIVAAVVFLSCKKSDDVVVAEVYHDKLYLSEIQNVIPDNVSTEDSISFSQQYIKEWVREKIILHEAEKTLTAHEKNFDKEIAHFRNSLLINAYYKKITSDSAKFSVSEKEMNTFMRNYENRYTVEREIIKLNYVKLSKKSKLIKPIKSILFDEEKRVAEKEVIEKLCGDSIEFFIEDHTWLYLDDIKNELPLEIENTDFSNEKDRYIETEDSKFHYLIVFLDYRTKRTVTETNEEIMAAEMMLLQQKKSSFIDKIVDSLYQVALQKDIIIK